MEALPTTSVFGKREISALRTSYARKGFVLTGRRIVIKPIIAEDQVGYTAEGNVVYLSFGHHPIFKDLNMQQVVRFINGTFAHEIMHQLITDMHLYTYSIQNGRDVIEQQIFAPILNILEDSACEYFAPEYMSDDLVRDILYMNAVVYKQSPPLEEHDNAFGQFMTALIQFGDAGLLKGEFTFPEAKQCFVECMPYISAAVTQPDKFLRVEYAEKVYETSRPLWQPMVDDQKLLRDLLKKLQEEFLKNQKIPCGGGKNGENLSDPTGKESSGSPTERRRKITFRKISEEEAAELDANGELGGDFEDNGGDIEILYTESSDKNSEKDGGSKGIPIPMPNGAGKDSDSKSNASSSIPSDIEGEIPQVGESGDNEVKDEEGEETDGAGGSGKDGDDNSDKEGTASASNGDGEDSESEGNESDSSKSESGESSEDTSSKNSSSKSSEDADADSSAKNQNYGDDNIGAEGSGGSFDYDKVAESLNEEYVMSEEDISRIEGQLTKSLEELYREERAEAKEGKEDFDFPIDSPGYHNVCKGVKVLNLKVSINPGDYASLETQYDEIVNQPGFKQGVSILVRRIKNIFQSDRSDVKYSTSGEASIKRMYGGKITANICEKRVNPANKSDLAVCFIVDESGSMGNGAGSKSVAARNCAIGLAEVFSKIKCRLSVFGFTADMYNADVVHFLYLNKSNTKKDRLRLLNISGRSDNFDGYSIRHAHKLLKKTNCQHKILIVISDGQPAAYAYQEAGTGIKDTRLAVEEASKDCVVIGVLIGRASPEAHKMMYGKDFVHVQDANNMFRDIGKLLKKKVSNI